MPHFLHRASCGCAFTTTRTSSSLARGRIRARRFCRLSGTHRR
jgi:hypothetical protein